MHTIRVLAIGINTEYIYIWLEYPALWKSCRFCGHKFLERFETSDGHVHFKHVEHSMTNLCYRKLDSVDLVST